MKRYIIGGLIVFALAVSSVAAVSVLGHGSPEPLNQAPATISQKPLTPEALLERANIERAAVGVAPLTLDNNVQKSAQLKADDMTDRNYRSHFLPEDPKATLTPEMASYIEPVCTESSENYVYDTTDDTQSVDEAFEWWMNSPSHKKAILDPQYTKTGFGISGSIVVQRFCVAK